VNGWTFRPWLVEFDRSAVWALRHRFASRFPVMPALVAVQGWNKYLYHGRFSSLYVVAYVGY